MFHRVDIWLRGLDLYYSVLKYRPTSLLNDEWLRGHAAIKLLHSSCMSFAVFVYGAAGPRRLISSANGSELIFIRNYASSCLAIQRLHGLIDLADNNPLAATF